MHHLQDAALLGVKGQVIAGIGKIVAHHLMDTVTHLDVDRVYAGILDGQRLLFGDDGVFFCKHFTGLRVSDGLGGAQAGNAVGHAQLLVIFVAAHAHQVIALGVKKQIAQQYPGAVLCGGFAGFLPAVNLQQRVRFGLDVGIAMGDGGCQALVVAQQVKQLLVGAIAQSAQNNGHRQLARAVDAHPQPVVAVGLIFDPGSPVGDDLAGEQLFAGFVDLLCKVDAGGTHQLADNHAFRAVDDKGAMLGHQGKVTHEDLAFLDFSGLLVLEPDKDLQRRRIG